MWRRVVGQVYGNRPEHDISDGDEEEDLEPVTYDNSCSERLMSLYAQKKEKGEIAAPPEFIPSQAIHVDIQKGDHGVEELEEEVIIPPLSSTSQVLHIDTQKWNALEEPEKLENSSEDDIEMEHEYGGFRTFSPRNERRVHSGVESSFSLSNRILDVEHEDCVWSAITKEANSLVCLHEEKSNSSSFAQYDGTQLQKGRTKRKHKLSFNFQPRNKYCPAMKSMKGESFKSSAAIKTGSHEHSVAERFEEFQRGVTEHEACQLPIVVEGEDTLIFGRLEELNERSAFRKGDGSKPALSCTKASHLGNRILDNEECLEFPGSDSSDDEANVEKTNQLTLAPAEVTGRAMVDIFQEAFSDVGEHEVETFKRKGIGFYERLQRVIQREKENQSRFLMSLQTGESSQDECSHVYVKILSRSFDGKLTVCRCRVGDKIKLLNCRSLDEEMDKTIMFQPKICGDVELEVGNVICIHPPWKEVQVAEDEGIILCMYFSQAVA